VPPPIARHLALLAAAVLAALTVATALHAAPECVPTLLGDARLVLTHLGPPPADDRCLLRGRLTVPSITALAGIAMSSGLGVTLTDGAHGVVLDVRLPAGTYEKATRRGWRMHDAGLLWRYADRNPSPPGGIRRAQLDYLGKDDAGRMVVALLVKGHGVSYAAGLAPEATVALEAGTGPCFRATFPGAPGPRCRRMAGGATVRCR
jgi:hypothetical protein